MFALAGPGLERGGAAVPAPAADGVVGGASRKGTLPGDGDRVDKQVKPTACSHRGGDGTRRWASRWATCVQVRESSAPSMPLPGSLSHKRGPGARRAAGSANPMGRGQGRAACPPASPPPPAGPAWLRGLWRARAWEQSPSAPRRGWGDGAAGDSRSKAPSAEGETETERGAYRKPTCHPLSVLWAAQARTLGTQQHPPPGPWPGVLFQHMGPSHAPETPRPSRLEPSS